MPKLPLRAVLATFTFMTAISQAKADTVTTIGMTATNPTQYDTGSGLTIDQNFSGAYNGSISGSGDLTVADTGGNGMPTVTLNGKNTYTGQTIVEGNATIAIGAAASMQSQGYVSKGGGGIDLSALSNFSFGSLTMTGGNGHITGASGVTTIESGSIGATSAILGNGAINITGVVDLQGTFLNQGGTTIAKGGELDVSGNGVMPNSGVTNYGTLNFSGSAGYIGGSIVNKEGGTLTNDGTPVTIFAGDIINDGTMSIKTGYVSGNVINTGQMTLDATGGNISKSVENSGSLTINGKQGTDVSNYITAVRADLMNGTYTSGSYTPSSPALLSGGLGVAAGATTTMNGYVLVNPNATSAIDGTLVLNDNTVFGVNSSYAGNMTVNGTIEEKGSSLIYGPFTISKTGVVKGDAYSENGFILDGGTITGTVNLSQLTVTANGGTVGSWVGGGSQTLNGTLKVENAQGVLTGYTTGTGTLDVLAGTQTISGEFQANLVIEKGATVTTGTTNSSAMGGGTNITLNGGTLSFAGGSNYLGSIQGSGSIINGSMAGSNDVFYLGGTSGPNAIPTNAVLSGVISDAAGVDNSGKTAVVYGSTKTWTLQGDNTYTGNTLINSGHIVLDGGSLYSNVGMSGGDLTVSARKASAIGSLYGGTNVILNNSLTINAGRATTPSEYGMNGIISGTGGITIANGTENFTGQNTYTGTTTIASGATLALSGTGTTLAENGGISGSAVKNNGVFDVSGLKTAAAEIQSLSGSGAVSLGSHTLKLSNAADRYTGSISGAGDLVLAGGYEALSGANAYSGGTTISDGAIGVENDKALGTGAVSMLNGTSLYLGNGISLANNISLAGDPTFYVAAGAGTITGAITDGATAGDLVKEGAGTLILSGDDTYSGDTTVNAGTLDVEGAIRNSQVTLNSGGVLAGTGSVSDTDAKHGSVIDATAGLSFSKDLTIDGGTLSARQGKVVQIAGDTQINGGTLNFRISNLPVGQTLTVLSSGGGVSGAFSSTNLINSSGQAYTYLSPILSYETNRIILSYGRNGVSFGGGTRNQNAVGLAVDHMTNGAILDAFQNMTTPEVRRAETMMSGEMLSSERTALIQNTDVIRSAVFNRLSSSNCYFDSAMALYDIRTGKRIQRGCHATGAVMWGQAFGSLGSNGASEGSRNLSHSNAGFIMGIDQNFGLWRAGAVVSYGRSNMNTNALASSAHSNDVSVGLYGGRTWHDFSLRLGASYTWNMISSKRSIVSDAMNFGKANADHLGGTAQAFAEVAYHFDVSGVNIEPFADIAYVNQQMTGYHETGSVAALHVRGSDTGTTFASVGSRFSKQFRLSNGADLTPYASLGYRHAFGNMMPGMHAAYAGGIDMDIGGTPLTQDAVTTELGVNYKLSDRVSFKIGYRGQYGQHYNDNGITGGFSLKF